MTMKNVNLLLGLAAAAGAGWYSYHRHSVTPFSYDGKVVLITGGSRGLGLVVAKNLAQRGARVVVCARDMGELQQAQSNALKDFGLPIAIEQCDVTDERAVTNLVARVVEEHGRIDVLINNAGQIMAGPLSTMQRSDFERLLDVHFWGPYNTMSAVLPVMRRQGGGRIANISSIGGKIAVPHLAPYSASKFALAGLSEGYQNELRREKIQVTTVFPGLMRIGSHRTAEFKGNQQAEYRLFRLADAFPPFSVSAHFAAEQIAIAIQNGKRELVIGVSAKLASFATAIAPNFCAMLEDYASRALPQGHETTPKRGASLSSGRITGALTSHLDQAALAHNEP